RLDRRIAGVLPARVRQPVPQKNPAAMPLVNIASPCSTRATAPAPRLGSGPTSNWTRPEDRSLEDTTQAIMRPVLGQALDDEVFHSVVATAARGDQSADGSVRRQTVVVVDVAQRGSRAARFS